MNHIFISYSRQDRTYARQLADDLSRRGFNVWIDDQIDYGERWFKTIVQAIQECAAMVVIMSPEADQSEWVEREILVAQRDKKPIFPLLLRGREFPLLITTQFANVQSGGLPPESFYTRLERIVAPTVKLPSVVELLSPLFEWVPIPPGRTTLEPGSYTILGRGGYLKEKTTFEIPAFAIAKYPITNAQYAGFIESGGYRQKEWWTEAGWRRRVQEGWGEPGYWYQEQWSLPDYPVVAVSWYEAVAFCRWLSALTGENVALPTEQQWQRAALGDDGRRYPWGNEEPDEGRCNYKGNIKHTTPVTHYPAGASPYGVMDMLGNVWEWCLTAFDTGQNDFDGSDIRMLRSGSWSSPHIHWIVRGADREGDYAYQRNFQFGFRVCTFVPT